MLLSLCMIQVLLLRVVFFYTIYPGFSFHSFSLYCPCFTQTPSFLYQSIAISFIHSFLSLLLMQRQIIQRPLLRASQRLIRLDQLLRSLLVHRIATPHLSSLIPHCEQSGCTCIISTRKLRLISSSLAHRSTPRIA